MSIQTNNGQAFEWAIILEISKLTGFTIKNDNAANLAQKAYNLISTKKQLEFAKAAKISIDHIIRKEIKSLRIEQGGTVEFNNSSAGRKGDVRDILIKGQNITIGISCKTNHQALKHSRLSDSIDFVKKWGLDDNGCSSEYWSIIKPLFQELRQTRTHSKKTALWENLSNKANKYYWYILNAWSDEITKLCSINEEKTNNVCKALVSYLVGKYDFYKVICSGSNRVIIQAYNFNNTLNTKKTNYPNHIYAINTKNGGIYSKTIVFNRGFSINFRIHNASSRVEPSLKFDINAIGLPINEVYQHTFDYTESN